MTTSDELYRALGRLRDAARGVAQRDRVRELADWRSVETFLRRSRSAVGPDHDDVVQDALVSIAKHVGTLEADEPGAAVAWVTRIVRHKKIDHARMRVRRLDRVVLDEAEASALDRLERDDGRAVDERALGMLVEVVEEGLTAYVATLSLPAHEAHLRRLQARATLHRVLGESVADLRAILALDESVGVDRLSKWVERGRPTLDAALERMIPAHEAEAATVLEALREAVRARRSDAGLSRPARRKPLPGEPGESDAGERAGEESSE
ncbi:MAG: sigma factor [Sandaracinus sp.]